MKNENVFHFLIVFVVVSAITYLRLRGQIDGQTVGVVYGGAIGYASRAIKNGNNGNPH